MPFHLIDEDFEVASLEQLRLVALQLLDLARLLLEVAAYCLDVDADLAYLLQHFVDSVGGVDVILGQLRQLPLDG